MRLIMISVPTCPTHCSDAAIQSADPLGLNDVLCRMEHVSVLCHPHPSVLLHARLDGVDLQAGYRCRYKYRVQQWQDRCQVRRAEETDRNTHTYTHTHTHTHTHTYATHAYIQSQTKHT